MCYDFSLQLLSEKLLILRFQRGIRKAHIIHVKCPLFLSYFNENLNLTDFSKNLQISNSMKICPARAELFHVVGRKKTQI